MRRCIIQWVGILVLVLNGLPLAQAVTSSIECSDGKAFDGIERTRIGQDRFASQKFEPAVRSANTKVLVVFLQGSSRSKAALAANRTAALNLSQQLNASTVAMQRQIYRSETGGAEDAKDDDYTPGNVALMATALDRLRSLNAGKKLLLIGHADGAVMAALLASRFPASADAYLLAACPCDLPGRLQSRDALTGKTVNGMHGLSPQDEAGNIRAGTRIALVVGNKDDNTLAKLSEAYVASLQRQGVKTRLTYAIGATHVSVLRSPEFFMLASQLTVDLSR
ncbi:MAG: hypothetical protein ABIR56_04620 [Polaromonas sp.]